mgnify:FL=1
MTIKKKKTGFVSLIGRTNVGKSTLLNKLLGQKISITSRRPQTTRQKQLGIKTIKENQIIFVDTPGYHTGHNRMLNKYMNRGSLSSIGGSDVILFIIEALKFNRTDRYLLEQVPKTIESLVLVINKVDKILKKGDLLPFTKNLCDEFCFSDVIPISALKDSNTDKLEQIIIQKLPFGEHSYPENQVADSPLRFLISEIIREKCITRVGEEIPYRLTAVIDDYKEDENIINIYSTIYIEKESQKGIVIGKKGKKLKAIGTAARKDMESILDKKVMLTLWVKVKKDWTDSKEAMGFMGYKIV